MEQKLIDCINATIDRDMFLDAGKIAGDILETMPSLSEKPHTVFILKSCVDHEGCSVYKVFSSKDGAEKEMDRLTKLKEEYLQECEDTDYEPKMKYPDCCSEDLYIDEFEIL